MATKFPKFSQALAQDPATRRIWYGVATAHDLESHDGMTEKFISKDICFSFWPSSYHIFMDLRQLISCCLAR
jgi:photosystem I P700 chlorophyll a apoprotein A2